MVITSTGACSGSHPISSQYNLKVFILDLYIFFVEVQISDSIMVAASEISSGNDGCPVGRLLVFPGTVVDDLGGGGARLGDLLE